MEMMLPIRHHMDQDFCAAVSKDLIKYCAIWEKRLATPDLWKQLPDESGVYMFVFASPLCLQTTSDIFCLAWVLYVGRAGDANSRATGPWLRGIDQQGPVTEDSLMNYYAFEDADCRVHDGKDFHQLSPGRQRS
jgi:hypothetical protein